MQLDDETVIKENGEDITLNDIKAGGIVRVRGTANRRTKTVDVNAVAVVTDRYSKHLEE